MIPNPIRKVLSSMHAHRVRVLLMGGQACVFYGAADFSRDTDFAILAETANLARLATAIEELQAKVIAASPMGNVSYEITIACRLLFDGFRHHDREISACGRPCDNRLEALQRIFEHELVHLTEQLCWENSDCRTARFQDIAHGISCIARINSSHDRNALPPRAMRPEAC